MRVNTVHGTLAVVESSWTWYRRGWRATVVSSVVQPVLFLLGLGFGFGSQVTPGSATAGLSYVEYLAPALMVANAVQLATFESSYLVIDAFKWNRKYVAMVTAPLSPAQVAAGQLTWTGLRIVGSSLAYLAVAWVLGALTGPGVLLSVVIAVLTGLVVAAAVTAYAATLESDQSFAGVFRFIIVPMMLFAGTFFPVDTLPVWLRPIAWATPLWHGNELARGAAFGGMDLGPAAGHLAYLVATLGLGTWLCVRLFRRRLLK